MQPLPYCFARILSDLLRAPALRVSRFILAIRRLKLRTNPSNVCLLYGSALNSVACDGYFLHDRSHDFPLQHPG
jgi:hypothetical protein